MSLPKVLKFGFTTTAQLDPMSGKTVRVLRPKDALLADVLAHALHVDYEIVMSTDGEFGSKLSNGTFTGPMGLIQREEIDIIVTDLGITEDRLLVANFSHPYFIDGVTFATRKPKFLPKYLTIISPFSPNVWMSALICLLFMSGIFYVVLRKNCSFQKVALKTLGSLLGQCSIFESVRLSKRLLLLSWALGTMFLTFSYTAVLLSFLTLPIRERGIQTIAELSEAIEQKRYQAVSYKGVFIKDVLAASDDRSLQIIGKDAMNNLYYLSQTKEILLDWNKDVGLLVARNYIAFLGDLCFTPEENFFTVLLAFAYKKSFCCRRQLDTAVLRLAAAGLHRKINDDFVFRTFLDKLSPEERFEKEQDTQLSLMDVSGAFAILILGYITSTCVFIMEIVIKKVKKMKFAES